MSVEAPRTHGPAWQRAIDFGVDVSLLEENLRLTPEQRLANLVAMQRLFDAIHGTVPTRPPEAFPGAKPAETR
jgi:hypothetical protein